MNGASRGLGIDLTIYVTYTQLYQFTLLNNVHPNSLEITYLF